MGIRALSYAVQDTILQYHGGYWTENDPREPESFASSVESRLWRVKFPTGRMMHFLEGEPLHLLSTPGTFNPFVP